MGESAGLATRLLWEQERLLERLEGRLAAVLSQALLNAVELFELVLSVLVSGILVQ